LASNTGYAKGNNIGAAAALGRYLVTLNNDVAVTPEWLKQPADLFGTHPEIGVVSCRQMNYFRKEIVDCLFAVSGPRIYPREFQRGKTYDPIPPSFVMSAGGASAIYRRDAFLSVGGFDEDFFAYREESDLCLRLLKRGWKCAFAPASVVYHKASYSFNRKALLQRYFLERNSLLYVAKNIMILEIIRHIPWFILGEIKDIARHIFIYHGKGAYFRARIDALRYIRSHWQDFARERRLSQNYSHYYNNLRTRSFIPLDEH